MIGTFWDSSDRSDRLDWSDWSDVEMEGLITFLRKNRSHVCVFAKYFIYLHRCTQSAARHDQEAFGYSAMVNLDNSLCNRNNRNAPLGMIIYRADIYSLRCERLFLSVARQSRAHHWNKLSRLTLSFCVPPF